MAATGFVGREVELGILSERYDGAEMGYPQVDVAEIWLRDPAHLNEVLVQARQDRVRVLHRPPDDLPRVAILGNQGLELSNDERRLIDPERM